VCSLYSACLASSLALASTLGRLGGGEREPLPAPIRHLREPAYAPRRRPQQPFTHLLVEIIGYLFSFLTHAPVPRSFFSAGDPGCTPENWPGVNGSSNPAAFNPTNLNVSQWVDSMEALGINEAVLTAKHGCGFYLWDTNVSGLLPVLPPRRRPLFTLLTREALSSHFLAVSSCS
jgi:hypothetical protein